MVREATSSVLLSHLRMCCVCTQKPQRNNLQRSVTSHSLVGELFYKDTQQSKWWAPNTANILLVFTFPTLIMNISLFWIPFDNPNYVRVPFELFTFVCANRTMSMLHVNDLSLTATFSVFLASKYVLFKLCFPVYEDTRRSSLRDDWTGIYTHLTKMISCDNHNRHHCIINDFIETTIEGLDLIYEEGLTQILFIDFWWVTDICVAQWIIFWMRSSCIPI